MLDKACLAVSQDLKMPDIATDMENNVRAGHPELRVRPNRAVLNDLGMTHYHLGLNLRALLAGLTPAPFSAGERSYDIRVRYDEADGVRQLVEQNFPGPEGRPFTLGAVADLLPRTAAVTSAKAPQISP